MSKLDDMEARLIRNVAMDVWNMAITQAAAIVREAVSLERAAEDIDGMRG